MRTAKRVVSWLKLLRKSKSALLYVRPMLVTIHERPLLLSSSFLQTVLVSPMTTVISPTLSQDAYFCGVEKCRISFPFQTSRRRRKLSTSFDASCEVPRMDPWRYKRRRQSARRQCFFFVSPLRKFPRLSHNTTQTRRRLRLLTV